MNKETVSVGASKIFQKQIRYISLIRFSVQSFIPEFVAVFKYREKNNIPFFI